jgi:CRP-like cAMP-binding protein
MIAGMLGMTPECLSRSLRQLQAHGVHSQGKRAILVEDRERLRAFAGAVG